MITLPCYGVFYGTTAALELPVLALRCLAAWHAWLVGFRLASTAVDLQRYREFQALLPRNRAARYIQRTALPQACSSVTAGDLDSKYIGIRISTFCYLYVVRTLLDQSCP